MMGDLTQQADYKNSLTLRKKVSMLLISKQLEAVAQLTIAHYTIT